MKEILGKQTRKDREKEDEELRQGIKIQSNIFIAWGCEITEVHAGTETQRKEKKG